MKREPIEPLPRKSEKSVALPYLRNLPSGRVVTKLRPLAVVLLLAQLCGCERIDQALEALAGHDSQSVLLTKGPIQLGPQAVELTRFRGHLNVRFGGIHDGREDGPVRTGV